MENSMNKPFSLPNRAGQSWSTSNIQWQEVGADGSKYALLEGSRTDPGTQFTYAFLIPAGFWDAPHWHSSDARIFVASGVLKLGYNAEMKIHEALTFRAGELALVPANAIHFDGADEETLIFGTAVGPWSTHYVDLNAKPSAGTIS
jgi:quercetin dioxygenase-like cupin family protein